MPVVELERAPPPSRPSGAPWTTQSSVRQRDDGLAFSLVRLEDDGHRDGDGAAELEGEGLTAA